MLGGKEDGRIEEGKDGERQKDGFRKDDRMIGRWNDEYRVG